MAFRRFHLVAAPAVALLTVSIAGCGTSLTDAADPLSSTGSSSSASPNAFPYKAATAAPSLGGDVTFAAVGDIACSPDNANYKKDAEGVGEGSGVGSDGKCRQRYTAAIVAEGLASGRYVGALALGDLQYQTSAGNELQSYDGTWGKFKDKTFPEKGNHDSSPDEYFAYWNGAASGTLASPKANEEGRAGTNKEGWYSFDTGSSPTTGWHVLELNSECTLEHQEWEDDHFVTEKAKSCAEPQLAWLRANLATTKPCTMAVWHKPVYYAQGNPADPAEHAPDGDEPGMKGYWDVLSDANTDIVLNGHQHYYSVMKPLDKNGAVVAEGKGIREFIVGTGGESLYGRTPVAGRSVAFADDTYGIMELGLQANSYNWQFVPAVFAENGKYTNSGSQTSCRPKTG